MSRVAHIGRPPRGSLEEYTATVHIHNFEQRCVDRIIVSPNFSCAGREWALEINPKDILGNVVINLRSKFESAITVDFDLFVRGFTTRSLQNRQFPPSPEDNEWYWGWYDTRRKTLNKAINRGTLTVDVRIRPHGNPCGNIIPQSNIPVSILSNLFENGNDMAFDVKGQLLYAHKIILKESAPDLVADFCDSCDNSNPLPIQDVDPTIFKAMLGHAYAKKIEPTMWKEHAKEILEASGKYGFNDLKSQAEAWYTKSINLTVDTVIDELLYADSYNLHSLKKATMAFIVKHGGQVMASDSYDRLDESPKLRKEVMSTFADQVSKKRQRDEE